MTQTLTALLSSAQTKVNTALQKFQQTESGQRITKYVEAHPTATKISAATAGFLGTGAALWCAPFITACTLVGAGGIYAFKRYHSELQKGSHVVTNAVYVQQVTENTQKTTTVTFGIIARHNFSRSNGSQDSTSKLIHRIQNEHGFSSAGLAKQIDAFQQLAIEAQGNGHSPTAERLQREVTALQHRLHSAQGNGTRISPLTAPVPAMQYHVLTSQTLDGFLSELDKMPPAKQRTCLNNYLVNHPDRIQSKAIWDILSDRLRHLPRS